MEVLFGCDAFALHIQTGLVLAFRKCWRAPSLTLFVPCNFGDKTMAEGKTKPVHEVRLGRVRAAIWENETQNGTRHNVTVSRLYKDGYDKWKDSNSFGREDLPLVCKVMDMAHTWIYEHPSSTNGNDNAE